ncbi:hypothetical protein [Priestia megaterium]|nr:hypothetical protein [Priestia megaterium]
MEIKFNNGSHIIIENSKQFTIRGKRSEIFINNDSLKGKDENK